jgi:hypothetical protein
MELDIFIPSLSLAVEYQGTFHYRDSALAGSVKKVQMRDNEKKQACLQFGITLIQIPHFTKKILALEDKLQFYRPDISDLSAVASGNKPLL